MGDRSRVAIQLINNAVLRIADAGVGPAAQDQIRRLYYLTSHLNAGAKTRIAGWKVEIARADSFTSSQATPGP